MISSRHNERGATSAIFALFLTALLGIAALVVDIGISWQERRHVITATDAAALAAVQDFAEGIDGCITTAPNFIADNNPDATMTACDHTPIGSGPGWVTVEAEVDVDFIFAGILGFTETTVWSSTTAGYSSATLVDGGLRPFGLCRDFLDELDPPFAPGTGEIYRIYYGREAQATNCNGGDPIPGNWAVLDFDGGANSQNDVKDWTENGYDGPVAIGDWIEGTPGSFSPPLNNQLEHLMNNVDFFTLPIFIQYNGGNGGNAEFLMDEFIVVRLDDFKTNGSQDSRYIDIEFLNEVVPGEGGGGNNGLGAFVIGVSAVDGVSPSEQCS